MIYQGALYRKWLQHKHNMDKDACNVQIELLKEIHVNYCTIIGTKIDIYQQRRISIPYSCNLNPYIWICDCINRGDYEFCISITNLYLSLLKRLHFEITYDIPTFDFYNVPGEEKKYNVEISYNQFSDKLTKYHKLILKDIEDVYPNVIMELNMTGKLPSEAQCSNWISSWKMYSKFINDFIISYYVYDAKYISYKGASKKLDIMRLQDFYESICENRNDSE